MSSKIFQLGEGECEDSCPNMPGQVYTVCGISHQYVPWSYIIMGPLVVVVFWTREVF